MDTLKIKRFNKDFMLKCICYKEQITASVMINTELYVYKIIAL
jgi:hypothetical protein